MHGFWKSFTRFCGILNLLQSGSATTKTVLKSIHSVIITIPFVHGPGAGCFKNGDTNFANFFLFSFSIKYWIGPCQWLLRADCSVQERISLKKSYTLVAHIFRYLFSFPFCIKYWTGLYLQVSLRSLLASFRLQSESICLPPLLGKG